MSQEKLTGLRAFGNFFKRYLYLEVYLNGIEKYLKLQF